MHCQRMDRRCDKLSPVQGGIGGGIGVIHGINIHLTARHLTARDDSLHDGIHYR